MSQLQLLPPVFEQVVYVVLAATTFALTLVAAASSVKDTLSMFDGLAVSSWYWTFDTV